MQKDLSQIFRENFNISEEDLTEARRIKAEKKRVIGIRGNSILHSQHQEGHN